MCWCPQTVGVCVRMAFCLRLRIHRSTETEFPELQSGPSPVSHHGSVRSCVDKLGERRQGSLSLVLWVSPSKLGPTLATTVVED